MDSYKLIDRTSDGSVWSCETNTIETTPSGKVWAWVRIVHPNVVDGVVLERMQYEVDCEQGTIELITFIDYDAEGRILRSVNTLQDLGRALPNDPVEEDTIGEAVLQFVCEYRAQP